MSVVANDIIFLPRESFRPRLALSSPVASLDLVKQTGGGSTLREARHFTEFDHQAKWQAKHNEKNAKYKKLLGGLRQDGSPSARSSDQLTTVTSVTAPGQVRSGERRPRHSVPNTAKPRLSITAFSSMLLSSERPRQQRRWSSGQPPSPTAGGAGSSPPPLLSSAERRRHRLSHQPAAAPAPSDVTRDQWERASAGPDVTRVVCAGSGRARRAGAVSESGAPAAAAAQKIVKNVKNEAERRTHVPQEEATSAASGASPVAPPRRRRSSSRLAGSVGDLLSDRSAARSVERPSVVIPVFSESAALSSASAPPGAAPPPPSSPGWPDPCLSVSDARSPDSSVASFYSSAELGTPDSSVGPCFSDARSPDSSLGPFWSDARTPDSSLDRPYTCDARTPEPSSAGLFSEADSESVTSVSSRVPRRPSRATKSTGDLLSDTESVRAGSRASHRSLRFDIGRPFTRGYSASGLKTSVQLNDSAAARSDSARSRANKVRQDTTDTCSVGGASVASRAATVISVRSEGGRRTRSVSRTRIDGDSSLSVHAADASAVHSTEKCFETVGPDTADATTVKPESDSPKEQERRSRSETRRIGTNSASTSDASTPPPPLFVKNASVERRRATNSAFNARRTIEHRRGQQQQQQQNQQQQQQQQEQEQQRSRSEPRKKDTWVTGKINVSVTSIDRAQSLTELAADSPVAVGLSVSDRSSSSPTLESERRDIQNYLYSTNLTSSGSGSDKERRRSDGFIHMRPRSRESIDQFSERRKTYGFERALDWGWDAVRASAAVTAPPADGSCTSPQATMRRDADGGGVGSVTDIVSVSEKQSSAGDLLRRTTVVTLGEPGQSLRHSEDRRRAEPAPKSRSITALMQEPDADQPSWVRLAKERRSLREKRDSRLRDSSRGGVPRTPTWRDVHLRPVPPESRDSSAEKQKPSEPPWMRELRARRSESLSSSLPSLGSGAGSKRGSVDDRASGDRSCLTGGTSEEAAPPPAARPPAVTSAGGSARLADPPDRGRVRPTHLSAPSATEQQRPAPAAGSSPLHPAAVTSAAATGRPASGWQPARPAGPAHEPARAGRPAAGAASDSADPPEMTPGQHAAAPHHSSPPTHRRSNLSAPDMGNTAARSQPAEPPPSQPHTVNVRVVPTQTGTKAVPLSRPSAGDDTPTPTTATRGSRTTGVYLNGAPTPPPTDERTRTTFTINLGGSGSGGSRSSNATPAAQRPRSPPPKPAAPPPSPGQRGFASQPQPRDQPSVFSRLEEDWERIRRRHAAFIRDTRLDRRHCDGGDDEDDDARAPLRSILKKQSAPSLLETIADEEKPEWVRNAEQRRRRANVNWEDLERTKHQIKSEIDRLKSQLQSDFNTTGPFGGTPSMSSSRLGEHSRTTRRTGADGRTVVETIHAIRIERETSPGLVITEMRDDDEDDTGSNHSGVIIEEVFDDETDSVEARQRAAERPPSPSLVCGVGSPPPDLLHSVAAGGTRPSGPAEVPHLSPGSSGVNASSPSQSRWRPARRPAPGSPHLRSSSTPSWMRSPDVRSPVPTRDLGGSERGPPAADSGWGRPSAGAGDVRASDVTPLTLAGEEAAAGGGPRGSQRTPAPHLPQVIETSHIDMNSSSLDKSRSSREGKASPVSLKRVLEAKTDMPTSQQSSHDVRSESTRGPIRTQPPQFGDAGRLPKAPSTPLSERRDQSVTISVHVEKSESPWTSRHRVSSPSPDRRPAPSSPEECRSSPIFSNSTPVEKQPLGSPPPAESLTVERIKISPGPNMPSSNGHQTPPSSPRGSEEEDGINDSSSEEGDCPCRPPLPTKERPSPTASGDGPDAGPERSRRAAAPEPETFGSWKARHAERHPPLPVDIGEAVGLRLESALEALLSAGDSPRLSRAEVSTQVSGPAGKRHAAAADTGRARTGAVVTRSPATSGHRSARTEAKGAEKRSARETGKEGRHEGVHGDMSNDRQRHVSAQAARPQRNCGKKPEARAAPLVGGRARCAGSGDTADKAGPAPSGGSTGHPAAGSDAPHFRAETVVHETVDGRRRGARNAKGVTPPTTRRSLHTSTGSRGQRHASSRPTSNGAGATSNDNSSRVHVTSESIMDGGAGSVKSRREVNSRKVTLQQRPFGGRSAKVITSSPASTTLVTGRHLV